MAIPTEPIGSIPRPPELLSAMAARDRGEISDAELRRRHGPGRARHHPAPRADRIACRHRRRAVPAELRHVPARRAEGAGARWRHHPVRRRAPAATARADRRAISLWVHAAAQLRAALQHATAPVKQAVIAPSALSLLYPADGLPGYGREAFLADLLDEAEADIRGALDAGAHVVQLDFTEGRLSLKLDPSGAVLDDFIALDNQLLERFTDAERIRIGVHTCPGGDHDSTHSLDVDYAGFLPKLFQLKAGNFYVQLASEADPDKVRGIIAEHLPASARIFIGVTDPIDPRVETPGQVRDRILAAARQLPADRLGTCDDCGFSPFADDTSTSRETAFAKIRARVEGTALASQALGL